MVYMLYDIIVLEPFISFCVICDCVTVTVKNAKIRLYFIFYFLFLLFLELELGISGMSHITVTLSHDHIPW